LGEINSAVHKEEIKPLGVTANNTMMLESDSSTVPPMIPLPAISSFDGSRLGALHAKAKVTSATRLSAILPGLCLHILIAPMTITGLGE